MLNLGKRVRGLFVKLPATEVIDLVAASGFDFAVVDLEHSQLAEVEAFRLLRHADARGLPALARIPAVDRGLVNRLLEAGAVGIHLSTVRRASEVVDLVRACRYAPDGARSIGTTHPAAAYGRKALADYLRDQREHPPLVVPQIETEETDDPLADIVAAGADVLFAGPTDLSVDVELDESRVAARLDEIARAADEAGVPLGAFGLDDERITYNAVTTDLTLLGKAIDGAG
ncbi:MAG TPA: aldolase/citrate lyase family protein [Gaiellaceae bacterium]|jgi:4-hydroxy-2-oxoheptanedioate aldolase